MRLHLHPLPVLIDLDLQTSCRHLTCSVDVCVCCACVQVELLFWSGMTLGDFLVRKKRSFPTVLLKGIILSRQTRDKRRESTPPKKTTFLGI
eukprot:COSAG06_NODE_2320_length_7089_cov_5.139628_11_plen_92_part_00